MVINVHSFPHCLIHYSWYCTLLSSRDCGATLAGHLCEVFSVFLFHRESVESVLALWASIEGASPFLLSVVQWWVKKGWGLWVILSGSDQCCVFLSLLWPCWLGYRKDIQPVITCATYLQRFYSSMRGGRKPSWNLITSVHMENIVSDIAVFVLKRDVKLQLTWKIAVKTEASKSLQLL